MSRPVACPSCQRFGVPGMLPVTLPPGHDENPYGYEIEAWEPCRECNPIESVLQRATQRSHHVYDPDTGERLYDSTGRPLRQPGTNWLALPRGADGYPSGWRGDRPGARRPRRTREGTGRVARQLDTRGDDGDRGLGAPDG